MAKINQLPNSAHIAAVTMVQDIKSEDTANWQLRKNQRKKNHLEHELVKHNANEQEVLESEALDNLGISESQDLQQNSWDHLMVFESRPDEQVLNQLGDLLASDTELLDGELSIQTRYLQVDELALLWDTFNDNLELKASCDDLCEELLNSENGGESGLLDQFMAARKLTTAQSYLLFCQVLAFLAASRRKPRFTRQMQLWLRRLEEQESSYLFEFFSLLNNPQLSKSILQHDLARLVQLSSSQLQLATLKHAIQMVAELIIPATSGMVSLYMKLRVGQLKQLSQNKLNDEGKAQFFELFRLEKYLMIINSLQLKQARFYEHLLHKPQAMLAAPTERDMGAKLLALAEFCEANYVSEFSLTKLLSGWQLQKPAPTVYLSFLHELINFLHGVPLILFEDKPANLQKTTSGIRKICVDANQLVVTAPVDNPPLNLFKSKKKLIKYV